MAREGLFTSVVRNPRTLVCQASPDRGLEGEVESPNRGERAWGGATFEQLSVKFQGGVLLFSDAVLWFCHFCNMHFQISLGSSDSAPKQCNGSRFLTCFPSMNKNEHFADYQA